ncbi:hypothetical protein LZ554_009223 [Drepanopeziza brunnea f. sp. 'monogermtubi']|nr:hypothetical protein LZ554_009223 [Drepanopeziza brunnea f. sp. 'monogermtubi']
MLPEETSEDKAYLAENSYKVRRLPIRLAAPVPGSILRPVVPAAALAAVPASDSGPIFGPAAPLGPTSSSTVAFTNTASTAASTSAMVLDDDPQGIYNASPDNSPRRIQAMYSADGPEGGIGSTVHLLDGLRINPVDPNFTPPVFAKKPATVKNDAAPATVNKPSVVNRLRSMVSMSRLPGVRGGSSMSNSRTTPNLRQSKSTYHFSTHKQQQYERISEENETDDGSDDGSLAADAVANHVSQDRLMTEAMLSTPHAEPAPLPPLNASGLQPSGHGSVYRSTSAEETATGAGAGTESTEEAERLVKELKKVNRKARMYHKETGEAAGEIDMTIEVARDDVETGETAAAAQVDHLFPPWETRYPQEKKVSGVKKAWLKLEAWGKKFNRK